MPNEYYREPASDPEAEGLPEVADDDSYAGDDELEAVRIADGPQPAALPYDDEEQLRDRYGVTPEEAGRREPLAQRLAQEVPDVSPDEPPPGEEDPVPGADGTLSLDGGPESVGRLVEPDEGILPDEEPDAVAYDAGWSGGGLTAEEEAMHETRSPE